MDKEIFLEGESVSRDEDSTPKFHQLVHHSNTLLEILCLYAEIAPWLEEKKMVCKALDKLWGCIQKPNDAPNEVNNLAEVLRHSALVHPF